MTENYLNILAETIRTNWDQPALTDFYLMEDGTAQDTSRGNHYTYGEMYSKLCRVAELLTSLGLKKGDHIAICGANSAHWVIAYLAIAKMQGVSVTVMHTLMPDEIASLVAFSDTKALFTDPDIWAELKSQPMPQVENIISLENFESLASRTSIIASIVPGASSETSASSPSIVSFPQSNPDSLAMICFTSGTSGSAKGVMLPYRSISANIYCRYDKLLNEYRREDIASLLPYGHIFALTMDVLRPLCLSMHIIVIHQPLPSIYITKCYQIIKPTYIVIIPQLLKTIVSNSEAFGNIKEMRLYIMNALGGKVKEILVGGARLPYSTDEKLIKAEIPMANGYGATECGPGICVAFQDTYKIGTVGKVMPNMEISISPVGEILVKGENVMLGYYKDPEATAAKIDSDGWLHTGDKGHLDEDGYLYVEGRLEQDLIVLPNGENIRPDHIESLINALPEVSESIVLARDGKLVAIVVPSSESREISETSENRASSPSSSLRRKILRAVNPQLPLFSQLYDVEVTDTPLQRTEKQTIKRYLYK